MGEIADYYRLLDLDDDFDVSFNTNTHLPDRLESKLEGTTIKRVGIKMTNQLHLFKKVQPKDEVKQEEFDDTLEERLKNYNDLIKRFKSM